MSKRQAIIASITIQGLTQAETARLYNLSQSTISRLINRYKTEGEAAFQPKSRQPKTSPTRIPKTTTQLILTLRHNLTTKGLDNGPITIQWHLKQHHQTTVSISTIRRRLLTAGLITPNPKKRPKSSYIRFQADQPNQTWQSDFTHWYLKNGDDTETITWLDDHSRFVLHMSTHRRITGQIVVDTFQQTATKHGYPASTLTDNGLVYTTSDSLAAKADSTPSNASSPIWESTKRTTGPHTQQPAAKSSDINKPPRNGSQPNPQPKPFPSYKTSWMHSLMNTTTAAPTRV